MEREPQPFSQQEVVIALEQLLTFARLQLHPRVADAPGVLRVEDEAVLEADADAPVVIAAIVVQILGPVARKQTNGIAEFLIDADTGALASGLGAVVGPEPEAIGPFGQRERRERVAYLAQCEQRLRKIGGVVITLLQTELQL